MTLLSSDSSGSCIQRTQNDNIAAALVFEQALSATECERIRACAAKLPTANVGVYPPPSRTVRKAETCLLDVGEEHVWLRRRLWDFARSANAHFQFDIDDVIHPVMQVAYAAGDFFDWHTDLGRGNESTRKISLSVQLSSPEEYDGGLLQMVSCDEPIPAFGAGTLVAFPAHLTHRVIPVTRGVRHALVAWVHGSPFK